MKIVVTGATGFVGRHVVNELLTHGHSVIAIARDFKRVKEMPWFQHVEFIPCDLHKDFSPALLAHDVPDALIHLAWPGLPNYRDFFHISQNLPADLAFLTAAVDSGISQLVVAGTCLEYGMQYGPLTEDMYTKPSTPYGFAKDALRKSLQFLQKQKSFTLQWMRLFYMHGDGQNANSLLAQLDLAIAKNDPIFNMSLGDQLRDYLSVQDVAKNFATVVQNSKCSGVINCSSGKPVSVFDLVRERCLSKASNIKLNRGYYPYPDYEPLAFWGIPSKLAALTEHP